MVFIWNFCIYCSCVAVNLSCCISRRDNLYEQIQTLKAGQDILISMSLKSATKHDLQTNKQKKQ